MTWFLRKSTLNDSHVDMKREHDIKHSDSAIFHIYASHRENACTDFRHFFHILHEWRMLFKTTTWFSAWKHRVGMLKHSQYFLATTCCYIARCEICHVLLLLFYAFVLQCIIPEARLPRKNTTSQRFKGIFNSDILATSIYNTNVDIKK